MKKIIDLTPTPPEPPKTYDIRLTGAQIKELVEVLGSLSGGRCYDIYDALDELVNDGTIT